MGQIRRMVSYPDVTSIAHKCRALRVLLLASLATAIAAGVYLSRNISDERQANLIRDLLKASYIVSLGMCNHTQRKLA